jgi:hypothetical protein
MKRITVLAAALLLGPGVAAPAADMMTFQKAYFGSTKPGSWSRYEQTNTDAKGKVQKSEVTLSHLETDGGRITFEMRSVPKEGGKKDKPVTMRYVLNTDFRPEKNALNYMKYVEKMVFQVEGEKAMEYPPDMMSQVAAAFVSNVDYDANVKADGACGADGRSGEKYVISGSFDFKIAFVRMKGTTETELCMSESVPFGRLSEKTVSKDEKGKVTMTTEMRLLETGTGAKTSIKGPVEKVEMPKLPWG